MLEKRFDVVVRGGTVVSGQGGTNADIAIRNGRIDLVAHDLSDVPAGRVIDASGKFILPGIIDAHVHPVYDDDFTGTSLAGLFGGVTSIVGFVGPNPAWGIAATSLTEVVKAIIEIRERESLVDFGLHGLVISQDHVVPQLPALVELGVISFKMFMAFKKRGMMLTDDRILQIMDAAAANGAMTMIHAENGLAIDYLTDKLVANPPVGNDAYLRAHRDLLEAEAIFRAVALAEAVRCPLYIVHVGVKEGVEVVRLFKSKLPMPLFLETCVYQLVITNAEVLKRGPLAKIAPPAREQHDTDAMWEGLRDGIIDVVGTDHCGIKAEVKLKCTHILDARFGAPGIEYLLPVTYSEGVAQGRISLGRMVQVLSENPAKIFGLWPRKGALVPGADADLVLFDPEERRICTGENGHSRSGYCLFEGRETVGAPTLVMQRGRVLMENNTLLGRAGDGCYLPGRSPVWGS